MKGELEGERTWDLSLKVFEVSAGEVGAAIELARRARRQRRGFILFVVLYLNVSEDSVWRDGTRACIWRRGMVLTA